MLKIEHFFMFENKSRFAVRAPLWRGPALDVGQQQCYNNQC